MFSDAINAPARITTEFILNIQGSNVSVEKANGGDFFRAMPTHRVNCATGADTQLPKTASTDGMHKGTPAFADGIVQIVTDALASNPLAFPLPGNLPSSPAPHIAYSGTFTYNTANGTPRFQGSMGLFPAYEAYAQLVDGPVIALFKLPPDPGTDAKDLFDFGAVVAILIGFAKLTREKEPDKYLAEVFMGEVSCLICAAGVSLRSPSTCISGTTSSSSTELVIYAPAHRRSGDTHSFTTFLKIP
jgi:hypothetical protein